MNTHEHGNTLQPAQIDPLAPSNAPAQTPRQDPAPITVAVPTPEDRPAPTIDRPTTTPQPNPDLHTGPAHQPNKTPPAQTVTAAKGMTPEPMTGAQSRFMETLERLQPADAQQFLRMSHEERDTHMEHSQAFARMSPEQAAEFAKLSMPKRSEYLMQHPELTQPSHNHSPNLSADRAIDRGGISY